MNIGDKVVIVRSRWNAIKVGDVGVIKADYDNGLFGIEVAGREDAYVPGDTDPLNDGYWAFFDGELEVLA